MNQSSEVLNALNGKPSERLYLDNKVIYTHQRETIRKYNYITCPVLTACVSNTNEKTIGAITTVNITLQTKLFGKTFFVVIQAPYGKPSEHCMHNVLPVLVKSHKV